MIQPVNDNVFSPALCRAARGYLGWSQDELASRSSVSRSTIRDFEGHRHGLHRSTEAQLRLAFENEGLRFTNNAGFPGLMCCTSNEG
ncbi:MULTISPECIES: helix-turn-helix domain-containing protein [Rhizobium]|uniref:Transcriptional regulator n=1 Tax=Rhizobium wuzhouense TaxID=1986026 RepID=A0ABX5NPJ0_9HYPH|nr:MULTISPECIES: helix-turn-helix transcriptional regulator [Rhizobium]PYB72431.1 transcriptional regulator [Rhizobium wuzhouense]RKE83407.1 helix-turn-helix protein [Rhizobium sp. AG855]